MSTNWNDRIAESARGLRSSAIRDLLKLTEQPEMISFAGGLPAPELFPAEEIAGYLERALAEEPVAALQYGPTEGYGPLRAILAERMAGLGIGVGPERILVTAGSQQALDLVGRLLIDPGAPVAVEEPTYLGALQAWQTLRPRYLSLPMDESGLQIEALEAILARGERPRFLYVVSCFQNPTGVTLAAERRRALVELAARHDLLIVEDDPYGDLYYTGERTRPQAAIDCELHGEPRQVLYLSTFSKTLTPGLRVGWLSGPSWLLERMALLKQGLDLHTGSLAQIAATYACADGLLEQHVPRLRQIYGARRETMLAALEREMPAGVRWTRPDGGMFLWLELPDGLNATALLERAVALKVAFVPGAPFHPSGGGANTMRLNFSHPSPERIVEGVGRLAAALRAG